MSVDNLPGPVQDLRIETRDERVVLAWSPPARSAPEPTKYYVVRMRIEGAPRVETTRFIGPSQRRLDDAVPPGTYRYLVGALAGTGSSPSVAVDVRVA